MKNKIKPRFKKGDCLFHICPTCGNSVDKVVDVDVEDGSYSIYEEEGIFAGGPARYSRLPFKEQDNYTIIKNYKGNFLKNFKKFSR